MQNTPLVQYVFSLNEADVNQFRLWLQSPFFNNRIELVKLLDWIMAKVAINNFTKQAAFDYIFPEETYDDQHFRHLMSYLLEELRRFLMWQSLQQHEVQQQVLLLENLQKRGLKKAFEKQLKKTKNILEKQPLRNQQTHFYEYKIQVEQYHFLKSQSREAKMPLKEIAETFTTFSIANLLKWHCSILTHKSVTQEQYDTTFLEQVLQHLAKGYYENIPAIQIYYQTYQALTTGNETNYKQVKTLILRHFNVFPINEIRDIILLAINFCIRKLNGGEAEYLKEVFEWYKTGLREKIFIINGELSRFTYKNITLAGLKLKEYEWTKNFMESHKKYIESSHRHDTYYFNLALWHQFQDQYDDVQELLQKVTFKDVLHSLHAKCILLKIYYETDADKALDSLLDSIKIYLYRHRKLGYHKDNYLKLVRYTQKLIRLNPHDKAAKKALRQAIENEKSLLEKVWFLEMLNR
jgi:hypothetical protein